MALVLGMVAANAAGTRTIYLAPSIWETEDHPVYAVHVWNQGDEDAADAWFTAVDGQAGVYSAEIRDDAKYAIFCRKNPADAEVMTNVWGGWWNRSITEIPADKNMYTITAWEGGEGDNKSLGSWSTFGDPVQYTTYHIYVNNQTGWATFDVYAWGTYEAFGNWPGATTPATQNISGVLYNVYDFQVADGGTIALHLIIHNNVGENVEGDVRHLFDISEARDYYLTVTAAGVQEGTTAVENVKATEKAMKVMRNGQMFIIRDGKTFNALGVQQ